MSKETDHLLRAEKGKQAADTLVLVQGDTFQNFDFQNSTVINFLSH